MKQMLGRMEELLAHGEALVLVTVTASTGATPRGTGARMLVGRNGRICGTIGGGAVEYRSEQIALQVLEKKVSDRQDFSLTREDVQNLGMICGGDVNVFFHYIPEGDAGTLALVREARRSGADFIKIMISGLMDFDRFGVLTEEGLPPEEIRELIHIAHEEGMAVMSHCNGARTAEAAAKYGVDSIDHGAYLDKDALQAMEDNGTVWVPTLSTIGNLRGKDRFNEDAVCRILDSALSNVAAYNGLLAAGTDAGAWAVPHGSTTEEGYFAMAGVGADRLMEGFRVIERKF